MKIVKDQGGQGKQIDGNGKTSGEVSEWVLSFLFTHDLIMIRC